METRNSEILEVMKGFQNPEIRKTLCEDGYSCIGLHNPQNPLNVGSVIRASACFDVAFVAISGADFKRNSTDVKHDYRRIPILEVENLRTIIPFSCVPIAVELMEDAVPLPDFQHPERGYYIFGGEHETLGKRVTSWCRHVIYVPTRGCLNLAACVNVVLYDRAAKIYKRKMGENGRA